MRINKFIALAILLPKSIESNIQNDLEKLGLNKNIDEKSFKKAFRNFILTNHPGIFKIYIKLNVIDIKKKYFRQKIWHETSAELSGHLRQFVLKIF